MAKNKFGSAVGKSILANKEMQELIERGEVLVLTGPEMEAYKQHQKIMNGNAKTIAAQETQIKILKAQVVQLQATIKTSGNAKKVAALNKRVDALSKSVADLEQMVQDKSYNEYQLQNELEHVYNSYNLLLEDSAQLIHKLGVKNRQLSEKNLQLEQANGNYSASLEEIATTRKRLHKCKLWNKVLSGLLIGVLGAAAVGVGLQANKINNLQNQMDGMYTQSYVDENYVPIDDYNQIVSDKVAAESTATEAQKAVKAYETQLNQTLISFNIPESILKLNDPANPTQIVSFSNVDENDTYASYVANLSEEGIQKLLNSDSSETLDLSYFASITDAYTFIQGYVNVYVPEAQAEIQALNDQLFGGLVEVVNALNGENKTYESAEEVLAAISVAQQEIMDERQDTIDAANSILTDLDSSAEPFTSVDDAIDYLKGLDLDKVIEDVVANNQTSTAEAVQKAVLDKYNNVILEEVGVTQDFDTIEEAEKAYQNAIAGMEKNAAAMLESVNEAIDVIDQVDETLGEWGVSEVPAHDESSLEESVNALIAKVEKVSNESILSFESMKQYLADLGYDVSSVDTLNEAWELVQEHLENSDSQAPEITEDEVVNEETNKPVADENEGYTQAPEQEAGKEEDQNSNGR